MDRELLIVLGPEFHSMSPASKSSRISTILKYMVQTISFIAIDNKLLEPTAHFSK